MLVQFCWEKKYLLNVVSIQDTIADDKCMKKNKTPVLKFPKHRI